MWFNTAVVEAHCEESGVGSNTGGGCFVQASTCVRLCSVAEVCVSECLNLSWGSHSITSPSIRIPSFTLTLLLLIIINYIFSPVNKLRGVHNYACIIVCNIIVLSNNNNLIPNSPPLLCGHV